jgi:UDP-N-acetylmuramate--alanine ligase
MQEKTLSGPVHFIGVGGSGMAGLAELARKLGFEVQGSDIKTSTTVERLKEMGIVVAEEHGDDLVQHANTVVYSSAISADNIELLKAKDLSLKLMHRSEFLASLMVNKKAITVAGTHGKSTTSAMITHVLDDLGCNPWAATGGEMIRYESSARVGQGELFVAEADESDGSFLKYKPFISILTNVEQDHMDFFKTEAAMIGAFSSYLQNTDSDGTAVIGWDHPLSRQIATDFKGNRLTYGFLLGCDVRAREYQCSDGITRFTAIVERDAVKCTLPMMGRHNVQNALCTLAVVRALELDVSKAAASLSQFSGVRRRMDRIYSDDDVTIFDDYAHNPGKVAAGVKALRETWPKRTLHVVFQPHRFSRLETMYDDMLSALEGADLIHVVPVYSAGESTNLDFSPTRLARDLESRLGVPAIPSDSLKDASDAVLRRLNGPSIILTVGAGDVWRVAQQLKEALK